MEKRMTNVKYAKPGIFAVAATAALGLALCVAPPAAAQAPPPNPSPSQQTPPSGQPQQPAAGQQNVLPAAPPVNKEEEDAYKAFYDLTPQQKPEIISQGEDFLVKYPTSRYRSSVYSKLVSAYLNTHQLAKMQETGQKALAENPDNVDVLAILCTIIPRTVDPRSLDADQKLSQAERYAHHAIEVATAMQKPEGMADDVFEKVRNEKLGLAHYGLGLINYMRGNTADSVAELDQATKLDPMPEPLEFYLLGNGDMKLKKYPEAAAAFDHCANAQWDPQWQARCKKGEADAKQQAASAPAPAAAPTKP
jgi:tetratricopeptide (TPR) repeat protein